MKIFCIVGYGRSGMDFLQSLFDGHPNISQFPGYFFFDKFWELIKNIKNLDNIADIFIKEHERFFNSKVHLIERHDQLGEGKNESFVVDKKVFKDKFIELEKLISKKSILLNLHLAYSFASGEKIQKKKIIVINIHNINHLKGMQDIKYKIFFTIRHPISSLSSGFKHWLNYSPKNVNNWFFYFQIERIFNGIMNCLSFKRKVFIVKLDLLHTKNRTIMKKVCQIMRIKYLQILNVSTYHKKKWWGDKLSPKYLNGVNKEFQDSYDTNYFFNRDIEYIEFNLSFFLKKYNYKNFFNPKKSFIWDFFPLKMELILWKKLLLSFSLIEIFSIPFYWVKRIKLIRNFNVKKKNYPILIK
jgi:hypothetical protein